ncbi:unnamed protein product [Symbiodinium sp. CCMP2592]|nr:unnamed protein product [Symbiodinium sp. CCMP2592]
MQSPSEDNVVRLLELWSPEWKSPLEATPPASKASVNRAACAALNHFLRSRFPDGTWTSLAVVNPRIGLHRDIQNMIGKPNHAIALGSFTRGRIWVEDDDGTSSELRVMKRNTQQLWGSWMDMHDKPVSFNARRFHKVEPHVGCRRLHARCSRENCDAAARLGFRQESLNNRRQRRHQVKAPSEGTK